MSVPRPSPQRDWAAIVRKIARLYLGQSGAGGAAGIPGWLARAAGPGPLIGAAFSGALLWIPSHNVFTAGWTALLVLLIIGALRAFDGQLEIVWRTMGRIPAIVRKIAGVVLPIWFATTQVGPSAAGNEISTARTTLLITTVVAYVLLHPTPDVHPTAGAAN